MTEGPLTKKIALREAILLAAEESGSDGAGTGGLLGYLKWIANDHPKIFANLLGRVVPLQLAVDTPTEPRQYKTPEEIATAMRARNLPIPETLFEAWEANLDTSSTAKRH